jgi:hypothetical protein
MPEYWGPYPPVKDSKQTGAAIVRTPASTLTPAALLLIKTGLRKPTQM